MLKRLINIDANPQESYFLWGPRQVGKSTLLRQLYPDAYSIDLLQADNFIKYNIGRSFFEKSYKPYQLNLNAL